MPSAQSQLRELARARGLQLAYRDPWGRRQSATVEAMLQTLRSLGEPLERPEDAAEALAALRSRRADRLLPEVVIAWQGRASTAPLRLGADAPRRLSYRVVLADGETRRLEAAVEMETGDDGHRLTRLPLPRGLPSGYHRLEVELDGGIASCHLLAAPVRTWRPGDDERREWGAFLPLHALHSESSLGIGDLGDLERLGGFLGSHGGSVLGTLPLLASFLDEPFEPSPYAPVSRRHWNELFLDLEALPELALSPDARALLAAPETRRDLERLAESPLIDYRAAMTVKRRILERIVRDLAEGPSERADALAKFAEEQPGVVDYARFRAATEKRRSGFWAWEAPARDGRLDPGDYSESRARYHLYVQWALRQQLHGLSRRLEGRGVDLYLDLPIGVHPDGYDVWRERALFVEGLSAGAPPDAFFTDGQDWGFQPMHPDASRAQGHRYLAECFGAHLSVARRLRIDHILGFHRLFVIPRGLGAEQGLYLRFPADELYAVLTIESHRHRAEVIGENLGVVPRYVNTALRRHGIQGMHVAQFGVTHDPDAALVPPAAGSLASLNTHDTPTFSGFWHGADIETRVELGLLSRDEADGEHRGRAGQRHALANYLVRTGDSMPAAPLGTILSGVLAALARSDASLLLVNLEDLWLEPEPQNVPGTHRELPNWRRKAAHSFESFSSMPPVRETLERIRRIRRPESPAMTETPDVDPIPSRLDEQDLFLFNEGTHVRLYEKLGAHPTLEGRGTSFAVWAPDAESVSVVGDFNDWSPDATPLQPRGSSGIWEGVVLGVGRGDLYKFHVRSRHGGYEVDKADPFAFRAEPPPKTASVVWDLDYEWSDGEWMSTRQDRHRLGEPLSIYEVHLGSWMRGEDGRFLGYREVAPRLVEHVRAAGFTHVELLPVAEHPFYGSWGYQVSSYFAPTSRFGPPQDLMFLIDALHQAGIGVILDWVPAHFPADEHGLAFFDGSHLYEHADPRRGTHPDWGTLIFNYGRREVQSFLLSNALFWLDRYHIDGLRVDAVASMLYLDYSRAEGEWLPNAHGGRENLEALDFLRRFNEVVYAEYPDVQTLAEESTAWPGVSRPTWLGGIGFGLKWDMGWMHDTLSYFARDPIHRSWHHNDLTFRMVYAFTENFLLPLSHDEVVHGKGSLIGKMPGDDWRKFAGLRLLYAYQWTQPGKKLLFMGGEIAQRSEWNHDASIEWHLLEHASHQGILRLVGDLNRLYRDRPALHARDCEAEGFEWVEVNDSAASVLAWRRRGHRPEDEVLVVMNFTPTPRYDYALGVSRAGRWRELLNTDAELYGGSGMGNLGAVATTDESWHGQPASLRLTLPPLAALILEREGE